MSAEPLPGVGLTSKSPLIEAHKLNHTPRTFLVKNIKRKWIISHHQKCLLLNTKCKEILYQKRKTIIVKICALVGLSNFQVKTPNKQVLLQKDFQLNLTKHVTLYDNNATYTHMRKSVPCTLHCFHICCHLSLIVRHNSYIIYCKKYENKHFFDIQKYTEYLNALFTVFFTLLLLRKCSAPQQSLIKFFRFKTN
jgi:hypothetical protein